MLLFFENHLVYGVPISAMNASIASCSLPAYLVNDNKYAIYSVDFLQQSLHRALLGNCTIQSRHVIHPQDSHSGLGCSGSIFAHNAQPCCSSHAEHKPYTKSSAQVLHRCCSHPPQACNSSLSVNVLHLGHITDLREQCGHSCKSSSDV